MEDLSDMAGDHEGGQLGTQGQVAPETDDEVVVEEAGQDEWQLRNDTPAALNLPQSDAKPESP